MTLTAHVCGAPKMAEQQVMGARRRGQCGTCLLLLSGGKSERQPPWTAFLITTEKMMKFASYFAEL